MLNSSYAMFIGLNPSTADETKDDPTIRRCINFAKTWGYGALCMVNLFAFRATLPADMFKTTEPIGDENDYWISEMAKDAGIIIAAWGAYCNRGYLNRAHTISKMFPDKLFCLEVTKDGSPKHPLYIRADAKPMAFR